MIRMNLLKSRAVLFGAPTCPACHAAREALEKSGIRYRYRDAENCRGICAKYGIDRLPAMMVDEDGVSVRYDGLAQIRAWIEAQRSECCCSEEGGCRV